MADKSPITYLFEYIMLFIFTISVMIYIYMIIVDNVYKTDKHTVEEMVWIYMFFVIIVIGFITSYYHVISQKTLSSGKKKYSLID